ncbi:beta-agarase [Agarivorans sp. 1_MG-2023]|uniref:beta-agarase n=1 Tax=Agarivorans sp. 1_MG-2023 TaxID=3062634 RepID=UPI0026E1BA8F|nr:beta-agarase [Agarivorans sp. 1_MG-2023]MDO6762340.1 beta-agarase [Agarivorans sp. 1_MG-2023]
MKIKLLTAAIAASLALPLSAASLVTSFEEADYSSSENNAEFLEVSGDATSELSTEQATDGAQSVKASFDAAFKPVIVWNWGNWNWGSEDVMTVDVVNPNDTDVTFAIKLIDNDIQADWEDDSQTSLDYFTAPANSTQSYSFNLNGGNEFQEHGANFDKDKVLGVQFMLSNNESKVLYFDNVMVDGEAVTPPPGEGAVNTHTAPVATLEQIADFETIPDYLTPDGGVNVSTTTEIVTKGAAAMAAEFTAGWNGLVFAGTWNWAELGEHTAVAVDVSNISDADIWLYSRIEDVNSQGETATRGTRVKAGESKTIFTSLNDNPSLLTQEERVTALGLRDIPADPMSAQNGWGDFVALDKSQITAIRYFIGELASGETSQTLVFDNMRIIKDLNHASAYAEMSDPMGQNNLVTYTGKVANKEELAKLSAPELAALGELTNRNQYGGNTNVSPSVDCVLATPASFNACKDDSGNWQLVDPDGNAFFSTGVDNIRLADTYTLTGVSNETPSELRQSMFTEIPSDYVNENYGPVHSGPVTTGQAVSYYGNNLVTRHAGEDVWRDITVKRMKDWGFNTLGNWTDPAFYDNGSVPYVANGWSTSGADRLPVKQIGDGYWGPLPDPWDANFATNAATMAAEIKAQVAGNEGYLLGIFVDNEMSWGNVNAEVESSRYEQTLAVFNTDGTDAGTSPAKNSFIYFLSNDRYPDGIADLNAVWGTSYASWDAMRPAEELVYNSAMAADLQYLSWQFAFQYFNTVKTALKAELPNHLYLGSRFADWGRTPDVVSAASAVVDVMSYNIYKDSISATDWDADALSQIEAIDKPVIIGEFHFGALDSGSFAEGVVNANSQQDRADKMVNFFESVNAHKNFVGAHWFQYIDSPLTGRAWDGENYNVGFVSTTDTPYTLMTDAVREFNCGMYGDDCSSLGNAAEAASRAGALYTGTNIGVSHSGPDAPEPGEPVDPPIDPPTPPSDVTGGGGSAGWLSLLGLMGVLVLRRRKV